MPSNSGPSSLVPGLRAQPSSTVLKLNSRSAVELNPGAQHSSSASPLSYTRRKPLSRMSTSGQRSPPCHATVNMHQALRRAIITSYEPCVADATFSLPLAQCRSPLNPPLPRRCMTSGACTGRTPATRLPLLGHRLPPTCASSCGVLLFEPWALGVG